MSVEVLETSPIVEPKLKNWPKVILAAVLGFALLFGAVYIVYWYGIQKAKLTGRALRPHASENWNEYVDSKGRFSVRYPEGVYLTPQSERTFWVTKTPPGPGGPVMPSVLAYIEVWDASFLSEEEPLGGFEEETSALLKLTVGEKKAVCSSYYPDPQAWQFCTYERFPDIVVSGMHAGVFKNYNLLELWEFPQGTVEKRIYIRRGHDIYSIGGFIGSENISEEMFDQILSTFKFLD